MEKHTTYKYFMAALNNVLKSTHTRQTDIAKRSGIAPQTISGIVRSKKSPGLQSQEKIAKACGYTHINFIQYGRSIEEGNTADNFNQAESPQKHSPEDQKLVDDLLMYGNAKVKADLRIILDKIIKVS